jgi:hypothetical protein
MTSFTVFVNPMISQREMVIASILALPTKSGEKVGTASDRTYPRA